MERVRNSFFEDCTTCTKRKQSIFCTLSNTELTDFDRQKSCLIFRKGQIIFHENSFPTGIYCIYEGKVKVAHTGNDGKEQIVRLLMDGDIIGYRALLSDTKYTANATAIEDTKVCFIPKDTFFNALRFNANLSAGVIKMLATELGHAEQTITDIAQKNVRERMAEALLLLKEKYGLERDGATINVVLSREDIANLVGTATETAIRLLSVYKQKNILEFVGKKIKILDMNALVKSANLQY